MEIEKIISCEIPGKHTNNGKRFCYIKADLQFAMKEKKKKIIKTQTYNGKEYKLYKINTDIIIFCFECPFIVQKKIVNNGQGKTE
jgi:hypothetical protein